MPTNGDRCVAPPKALSLSIDIQTALNDPFKAFSVLFSLIPGWEIGNTVSSLGSKLSDHIISINPLLLLKYNGYCSPKMP